MKASAKFLSSTAYRFVSLVGEAMEIDFIEGWASDLALEDVNALDLDNLM